MLSRTVLSFKILSVLIGSKLNPFSFEILFLTNFILGWFSNVLIAVSTVFFPSIIVSLFFIPREFTEFLKKRLKVYATSLSSINNLSSLEIDIFCEIVIFFQRKGFTVFQNSLYTVMFFRSKLL